MISINLDDLENVSNIESCELHCKTFPNGSHPINKTPHFSGISCKNLTSSQYHQS